MDYVLIFNACEAVLWFSIGAALLFTAFRHSAWRGRLLIAACGFTAFGFTDVVEMGTGAWWRPWWLFVWKAACVLLLAAVGVHHYRNSDRNPANSENSVD